MTNEFTATEWAWIDAYCRLAAQCELDHKPWSDLFAWCRSLPENAYRAITLDDRFGRADRERFILEPTPEALARGKASLS